MFGLSLIGWGTEERGIQMTDPRIVAAAVRADRAMDAAEVAERMAREAEEKAEQARADRARAVAAANAADATAGYFERMMRDADKAAEDASIKADAAELDAERMEKKSALAQLAAATDRADADNLRHAWKRISEEVEDV